MSEMLELAVAVAALSTSAILLGHVKAKTQSVLIHHATHGQLWPDPVWNRRLAQALGIVTLNSDFDSYRLGADRQTGHRGHHGRAFATVADEEGRFVLDAGFRPGMSRQALWRRHWQMLFSPRFHAQQARRRLQMNFLGGSWRRRVAAWAFWASVLGGAAAAGLLLPLLLTLVLGLGLVGQGASWVEQASRHRWLVSTPGDGLARHAALSHARLLGAAPPPEGPLHRHLPAWLRFGAQTLAALMGRLLVVQADLPHHHLHHLGQDRPALTGRVAWTDSADAHASTLWQGAEDGVAAYSSLHAAIDAWFDALSKEPPLDMALPGEPRR